MYVYDTIRCLELPYIPIAETWGFTAIW